MNPYSKQNQCTPTMHPSLKLALPLLLLLSHVVYRTTSITETETHLHFYLHDIPTGSSQTAVRIAQATATASSNTFFGALVIMDDPLTEGPDPNSKLIGRAQGMYAFASQAEVALTMMMNFDFVEGEHNGSTLAVLGRNDIASGVREMPILGGSKKFRFARGYVEAKTNRLDAGSGNTVVEYDVYVLHQDVKVGNPNLLSSSPKSVDPNSTVVEGSGSGGLRFGGISVFVSAMLLVSALY